MKYNVVFKDDFNKLKFVVSYINRYGHYDIDADTYKRYGIQHECYDFSRDDKSKLLEYFDCPESMRLHLIPRWIGSILSLINKICD